jgi:hypothetical protein
MPSFDPILGLANPGGRSMATPALDKMMSRLRSMELGEAGILVSQQDIIDLEIAAIPDVDVHGRVEWLCEQLPFECEVANSVTTSDISIKRLT